jgi:hypothetical protein
LLCGQRRDGRRHGREREDEFAPFHARIIGTASCICKRLPDSLSDS